MCPPPPHTPLYLWWSPLLNSMENCQSSSFQTCHQQLAELIPFLATFEHSLTRFPDIILPIFHLPLLFFLSPLFGLHFLFLIWTCVNIPRVHSFLNQHHFIIMANHDTLFFLINMPLAIELVSCF
jgi:hypothetical protein